VVSSGEVQISGTSVTFTPGNGGNAFIGILTNTNGKWDLKFPNGIPTNDGKTITGFAAESSSGGTPTSSGGGGGGGGGGSSVASKANGGWKTSTGNNLIVMDPAMVNSKLKSATGISPNRTLVFENLEAKDTPVKGDIINSAPSAAAPNGFLYKVKSVTTSGGRTVIVTEMATIEEAVEKAKVKQSFDLVLEESDTVEGVELVRAAANANPTQRAAVSGSLSDDSLKLKINKTVGLVSLNGSLEIGAALDCDLEIDGFKVKNFELSTKPQLKAGLTATISGEIENEIVTIPIKKFKFKHITFTVGPVLVVIKPEIAIECVVTAKGEVLLSAELVKWDYSYTFGVRYKEGGKLNAFNTNMSKPAEYLKNIQINLINAEVKVAPTVSFSIALYDTITVGISGSFYARLAGVRGSGANAIAKLSFYCGLEFGVKAELEILSHKIGELETTFPKPPFEWKIWERIGVSGVTLQQPTLSLAVNGTYYLFPTVSPSDATNKKVTWSSSNTSVATVASDGKVTGKSAGSATITATTEDGGKKATCFVTVATTVPVTGISLDTTALSLPVNGTYKLIATVAPPTASNTNVIWSSNVSNIASVSSDGVVTAHIAGASAVIIATAAGDPTLTAHCNVTVLSAAATVAVTGVSLNKTTLSLAVGGTEKLAATIAPSNATNKGVTWTSGNTSVAAVASDGTVTGLSAGTADITVKTQDGNKTAACTVTVSSVVVTVNYNVSTLAGGSGEFYSPQGVAVDSAGNVYVADRNNNRIRKITPGGVVSTLAGTGDTGFQDGPALSAKFSSPSGVAVDASGNVYVADTNNNRIRKISDGVVSTLAGSTQGFEDGPGASAKFKLPQGVAVDSAGNVYVVDTENYRIRKITPGGVVSTLAGDGTSDYADGPGASAKFSDPKGVAVDASGNVYVGDTCYGIDLGQIRKITPGGVVSAFAGSTEGSWEWEMPDSGVGYEGDDLWIGIPYDVAVDSSGNVYVLQAESYLGNNPRIIKITPDGGVVSTLAGGNGGGFQDGPGASAKFSLPHGVAVDSAGNVYVADTGNNKIRKLTPAP